METTALLLWGLSAANAAFLLMHELDAFHLGEWRMFAFLNGLSERSRYLLFLYLHFPYLLLLFYYLQNAASGVYSTVWVLVNVFSLGHLAIHLLARRWKSNVFSSAHSFVFIVGAALASAAGLLLRYGG